MDDQPLPGYREIEHTADWELEVWAPDMPALMERAARGMYALTGVRLKGGSRDTRQFELTAIDPESMLVAFLDELLWILEDQSMAFDGFNLSVEGDVLHAELGGAQIETLSKEIKAVTYHNLDIRRGPRGFEVNIVFDV